MTKQVFIDTDCISAFLWVNNQSIIAQLFPKNIIIPSQVYRELSNPLTPHLKSRIDELLSSGDALIESSIVGSSEYNLYYKLTHHYDENHKIIGDGEAAAIAMAKERNGILASNNLRDISNYVEEFNLEHITTGDILKMALDKGLINEHQGNTIWANMLNKKRKLGFQSFSDYLKSINNPS